MLELRVSALLALTSFLACVANKALNAIDIDLSYLFGFKINSQKNLQNMLNQLVLTCSLGVTLVSIQRICFPKVTSRVCGVFTLMLALFVILRQQLIRNLLKRVIRGQISQTHRLGDLVFSDTLVSLAQVFSDIVLSIFLTLHRIGIQSPIDRQALMSPLIPLTASIPFVIRMKQCIADYMHTKNKSHLLNMLKYLVGNSVNAVRVHAAVLKMMQASKMEIVQVESKLIYLLFANAVFSLTWDLVMDFRMARVFHNGVKLPKFTYLLVALFDLGARFAFLFAVPYEHVVFGLQALEIFRRGVWVIFRVEAGAHEVDAVYELKTTN